MFADIPLFSGLSPEELGLITAQGVIRSFPKSTIVISEGDSSDTFFVILSGSVKVFVSDEDGRMATLSIQRAGEHFGELALIDGAPRSASVMTIEPSKMAVVHRSAFEDCLQRNPEIALKLLRTMAQRIRALTDSFRDLALFDVYDRVVHALHRLSSDQDSGGVVDRLLTQQEIANMIGASREMVNRVLRDLAKHGHIRLDGGKITVLRPLARPQE